LPNQRIRGSSQCQRDVRHFTVDIAAGAGNFPPVWSARSLAPRTRDENPDRSPRYSDPAPRHTHGGPRELSGDDRTGRPTSHRLSRPHDPVTRPTTRRDRRTQATDTRRPTPAATAVRDVATKHGPGPDRESDPQPGADTPGWCQGRYPRRTSLPPPRRGLPDRVPGPCGPGARECPSGLGRPAQDGAGRPTSLTGTTESPRPTAPHPAETAERPRRGMRAGPVGFVRIPPPFPFR
jgi:hypothetical protein